MYVFILMYMNDESENDSNKPVQQVQIVIL